MKRLNLTNSEVSDIISGCRVGDKKQQAKLYFEYNKYIQNICFDILKNKEESEDLTQDIIIYLFSAINKFDGSEPKKLTQWVKIITKHKVIDYIRSKKISYNQLNDLDLNSISETMDLGFLDSNLTLYDIILGEVKKLSPQYKKVFELYYIDNYNHEEIAEELGLNVGTSKSNLFKAKRKLLQSLNKYNNKIKDFIYEI